MLIREARLLWQTADNHSVRRDDRATWDAQGIPNASLQSLEVGSYEAP